MNRTFEEAYASASESSDLTLTADKRGDADVLIAAGWSESRLGGTLMRLQTKASMQQVLEVLDQIERVTRNRGISMEATEKVLAWWLKQACKPCNGLKFIKVPDAPTLSTKACPACRGSGLRAVPHGPDGKWVANYLDDCVSRWRASLKGRFQHQQK